ncbi:hypothetical protein OJ998_21480 [Solirubrobacter taibaiensis]|nr:hypothetical protein [Solirubrobacter taibaiensis]
MDEEVEGGVSWIVIVAVVAIVVAAAAFFAGRALAGGGGPETLSEAVAQAQAGDLPCGDVPAAPTPDAAGGDPAAGGAPPMGAGGPGGAGGASFALRAICSQTDGQQAGGQGQGGMPGGGFGGRGFGQQVKSIDGEKLTLTGPQGDTTVTLGPDTTVSKSAAGEAADIKAGDSVIVSGGRQGEAATSVIIVPAQN